MLKPLLFILALSIAPVPAAVASEVAHRKEDAARHTKMATAHKVAADCLKGGAKPADCLAKLQADCAGAAIGKHCGLRTQAGRHKDEGQHIAEHERMAAIHADAAACMLSDTAYKDCMAALSKACGGIGVGKYCGMRHAH
jgi:hypothetical protein